MPVKILHGDRDFAVPVRYARRSATLIPNVQYRKYEGCGRRLPRERPADVVQEIAGFVTE